MLYCVYGFNFICDHFINKYRGCVSNQLDENLPAIYISRDEDLDIEMTECVETANDFCSSRHSIKKSYFRFADGNSILITPYKIQFGGNEIDDTLIGGADIIVLSRLHGRAVLHGSAFLYCGKAYLLCAYPGAGKSTLSAAMSKYHNDISVLTDDIICIRNDGTSIYNGLPHVSLNNDSYHQLYSAIKDRLILSSPHLSTNSKTTLDVNTCNVPKTNQSFKIGGIFFLDKPLENELVKMEKFNKIEFFCEALKNIKFRQSLVGQLLTQEMQIVNNMVNNNIFGVKLRIKHDYSELQEITNRIVDYIDKQAQK